jgi:hypothetical protein
MYKMELVKDAQDGMRPILGMMTQWADNEGVDSSHLSLTVPAGFGRVRELILSSF